MFPLSSEDKKIVELSYTKLLVLITGSCNWGNSVAHNEFRFEWRMALEIIQHSLSSVRRLHI